jgi:hypothetical protein
MHSLDGIITRNAQAAGREAAHADNDGDFLKAESIKLEQILHRVETGQKTYADFWEGYRQGRAEG